jgi:hypothetical protein
MVIRGRPLFLGLRGIAPLEVSCVELVFPFFADASCFLP